MAEWLKATDCKSVLSGVRRFEPCSAHKFQHMLEKSSLLMITVGVANKALKR